MGSGGPGLGTPGGGVRGPELVHSEDGQRLGIWVWREDGAGAPESAPREGRRAGNLARRADFPRGPQPHLDPQFFSLALQLLHALLHEGHASQRLQLLPPQPPRRLSHLVPTRDASGGRGLHLSGGRGLGLKLEKPWSRGSRSH